MQLVKSNHPLVPEPPTGSIKSQLEFLMDPEANGFKLMTYEQIISNTSLFHNEIWTDDDCLLIAHDVINGNIDLKDKKYQELWDKFFR